VHDGGHQQAADKQGVDQHGNPRPKPNSCRIRWPPRRNDPKTTIMMPTAAAMIGPLLAWPTVIAR
jgi:hypothetical protein